MKIFSVKTPLLTLSIATTMLLTACGGTSKVDEEKSVDFSDFHSNSPITINSSPVDRYEFDSKFKEGSSVSYTGQTARHALIDDMATKFKNYAEGNGSSIDDDVKFFMEGPTEQGSYTLSKITDKAGGNGIIPGPTYGDISSGKNLKDKVAGEDKLEHITGAFTPWLDAKTPVDVIYRLTDLLKEEVNDNKKSTVKTLQGSEVINETYIDGKGRDLNQLTHKYLLMAVAFNQGTSDYLRTNFASLNQNSSAEGNTKAYTESEHKWDEAFGYFGASRNYGQLSDGDIKSSIVSDFNSDGKIDLRSEANQGAAVNCAKRDSGSEANANPTNFTKQAFDAFTTGRKALSDAANTGSLNEKKVTAAAEQAAYVWEQCIAATVVHYINDTNSDLDKFISNSGAFNDVDAYKKFAKHWSEMKGFAIGLQFNQKSPFHSTKETKAAYDNMITNLMGEHPKFASTEEAIAYKADLLNARKLLKDAYQFDEANVASW